MVLTAAEKQKRYRAKNKVTRVTKDEQQSVTVTEAVCHTCGGPVQHPKIVKCLMCSTGTPAPKIPATLGVLAMGKVLADAGISTGPLSVYSEQRWARQNERYIWDFSRGGAYRGGYELVTVPGDPAYQERWARQNEG